MFVFIYYRLAGLIALLGLAVNLVLLLGLMAMFNFVLTLPGIAGIILTIGMAVDANVLVYERLREELHAGKSLIAALNGAYEKALSAIVDANLTTLITSVILFMEASGSVKGFAVTLTLGIIASMFSALLVTRTIFRWLTEKAASSRCACSISPRRKNSIFSASAASRSASRCAHSRLDRALRDSRAEQLRHRLPRRRSSRCAGQMRRSPWPMVARP